MKISIIIPAYNEEKLLPATLLSIRSAATVFTERGCQWELVVCDNNSTDRTAAIAREAGATVIFEPVNQIARARNAGASAATGDWFVFVDADSHPSRELFVDVIEQIRGGRCVAGGVTVRMDTPDLFVRFSGGVWNLISRLKRWCAGAFIFCDAAAFRVIGGFSHEFYVSEEIELSDRLKAYARTVGGKVVILHRHPLVTSARKVGLYGFRGHLRFLVRLAIQGRGMLKDPAKCEIWYDGKR